MAIFYEILRKAVFPIALQGIILYGVRATLAQEGSEKGKTI
jgi:hypothetical protein